MLNVRVLALLLTASLLAGCTFMYQRRFVAEPAQELSAAEQRQVFEAFKRFLIDKGLTPLPIQESPAFAAFRIGAGTSGLLTRSQFSDILEIKFVEPGQIELRLIRVIAHPADFSSERVAAFVRESEAFIQEASGKQVHLRLVSNGT